MLSTPALWLALVGALQGVQGPPPADVVAPPAGPLLIVAPHPDDEVLMAAGAIHDARAAGVAVTVVVVTTGGLGCDRSPDVRQAESVAGLATLGLVEDDVVFLGYPDGHLIDLGPAPLPPVMQRDHRGACVPTSTTTAWRGRGRMDAHRARTGQPAPFSSDAVVDDLVAVLRAVQPGTVIVSHDADDHPDHARTGLWLRRALEVVGRPATVWRSVVHHGPCWPMADARGDDAGAPATGDCAGPAFQPTQPMPPLPGGWTPSLRRPVDADLKLRAIAAHRSQTGPVVKDDWLAAFARRDEVFFPMRLVPSTTGALRREDAVAVELARSRVVPDPHAPGTLTILDGDRVVGHVGGQVLTDPQAGPVTLHADRDPADSTAVDVTVRQGGVLVGAGRLARVAPVGVSHLETPAPAVPR